MMRALGTIFGTDGLDLLILALEVETIEQIEVILLGVGVKADDIRRQLAMHIPIIG